VTGEGAPLDRRIPLKYRVIAHLLGRLEKRLLGRGKHGGLPELAREASQDFWEHALKEYADAVPIVGPKTYYITAESPLARLRLFKRAMAWYLRTHFGANDGVVALEDQSLAGLGTVIAVLEAGHTDLTNRFPSARAKRRLRRSLIQGILFAVGREETQSADPSECACEADANAQAAEPSYHGGAESPLRVIAGSKSTR
jgi:hypothetical protein